MLQNWNIGLTGCGDIFFDPLSEIKKLNESKIRNYHANQF